MFRSILFVSFFLFIIFSISIRGIKGQDGITNSSNSSDSDPSVLKRISDCKESDTRCTTGWCYRKIDLCDGWYDCIDGYDESPEVCEGAPDITKFECLNGKFINVSQVCNGVEDCKDGLDEADSLCEKDSNITCAIPYTSTLTIQCEFKGKPIPCNNQVRSWSSVKVSCNTGYVPKDVTQWIGTNKCRNSGRWLHRMPSCTFDCGSPMKEFFPWNIIIYVRNPIGQSGFQKFCLGTLITPQHVLTDSRCDYKRNQYTSLQDEIKIGQENLLYNNYYLENHDPGLVPVMNSLLGYDDDDDDDDDDHNADDNNDSDDNIDDSDSYDSHQKPTDDVDISTIHSLIDSDFNDSDDGNSHQTLPYDVVVSTIPSVIEGNIGDYSKDDIDEITKLPLPNNLPEINKLELQRYGNIKLKMIIYELESPIDLTAMRPVCFDIGAKLELNSSLTGKVVMEYGRYVTTPKLAELRILSRDDCQKYLNDKFLKTQAPKLNYDEFCAIQNSCDLKGNKNINRTIRKKEHYNILAGAGMTVNIEGRYHLYGMHVGEISFSDEISGGTSKVFVFSNVLAGKRKKWFKGVAVNVVADLVESYDKNYYHRRTSYYENSCYVPFAEGSMYTSKPCVTIKRNCTKLIAHKKMEEYSVIFIYCQENYTLNSVTNNYMVCEGGIWTPNKLTCVRLCEPLITAPSVMTDCFYETRNVSCTNKVMADTIAASTCGKGDINTDLTTYNNTCLHNGNWRDSPEVVEILCIDLCGILKSERALVQDGVEADSIYHPWNAALYFEHVKGHYYNICGGTLVSKHAVLTAAHCLHHLNGMRLDARELKIGLGTFYRVYNHPRDSEAQIKDVESVYIPNLYDGAQSAYVADIAILELKTAANLNEFVVPACIDTTNKFTIKPHTVGNVVGWGFNGIDKNAKQTDTLMKAKLPYLNRTACINKSQQMYNIRVRMTGDKFCGDHFEVGKPIVRRGDSGAGLTFNFEGRHYIYGLVSIQMNNVTTMFTNVTYPDHLDFINRVLNEILENKKIILKK